MNNLHKKTLKLAKQYYKKENPDAIPQLKWMLEHAEELIERESLDVGLLLPLCFLLAIEEKQAVLILEGLNYEKILADTIVRSIKAHNSWIRDEHLPYPNSKEMGAFNDLNFIYPLYDSLELAKKGQSPNKEVDELYLYWIKDEQKEKHKFSFTYTAKLFETYLKDLTNIINN